MRSLSPSGAVVGGPFRLLALLGTAVLPLSFMVSSAVSLECADYAPGAGHMVAHVTTAAPATGVLANGSYAYVLTQQPGSNLSVVDMSDPRSPVAGVTLGTPGGYAWNAALQGNYLYVADGPVLSVLDVSDAASPALVAGAWIGGAFKDVEVSGAYAYLTDSEWGLYIVNISDPASPHLVSVYPFGSYVATDVVLDGARAYAGGDARVQFFDVSNPIQGPAYLGGWTVPEAWNPILDLEMKSGLLCVRTSNYIYFLDVSNPASAVVVGIARGLRAYDDGGLSIVGDQAYVSCSAGIGIVDIRDPAHPGATVFVSTPDPPHDAVVRGGFGWVADGDGGLQVMEFTDPARFFAVSRVALPGSPYHVEICGTRAYAGGSWDGDTLDIVDLANPLAPSLVAALPVHGQIHDISVGPTIACLAVDAGGLDVVALTGPQSPRVIANVALGNAHAVALSGTLALVGTTTGLYSVDLSSPAAPVVRDTLGEPAEAIVIEGPVAYLQSYSLYHLAIIDVSDPGSLAIISTMMMNGDALEYANGRLFATDFGYCGSSGFSPGRVEVIDVCNPGAPVLEGQFVLDDCGSSGLAVRGSYALTKEASFGGRWAVLDVSNPADPAFHMYWTHDVALDMNEHCMVSVDGSALAVFRTPCVAATTVPGALNAGTGLVAGALRIQPNPGANPVLRFELPRGGDVDVALHDVSGRCVRHLHATGARPGAFEIAWDGRDGDGTRVANGVYFARVTGAGLDLTGRIVLQTW